MKSIKNYYAIDIISTSRGRAIKRVGDSSDEADKVGIINTDNIKVSKSAKSKDLV